MQNVEDEAATSFEAMNNAIPWKTNNGINGLWITVC